MGVMKSAILVLVVAVIINRIPSWFTSSPPLPPVQGYAAPGFEHVEKVYKQLFEDGEDWGSSFAVYYKGDMVVDMYGGFADEQQRSPWTSDTITRLFSTSKAIGALACAILSDRGYLDYKKPVVEYWPEFGVHGKDNITVEMLVSHQAGLSVITDETYSVFDDINDIDKVGRMLANQEPLWPPGTNHGYHALTLGLYMDQLVRRTDPKQRGIPQFLRDEVADIFDIDLFCGVPTCEQYRVAKYAEKFTFKSFFSEMMLWFMLRQIFYPNSVTALTMKNPKDMMECTFNKPDSLQLWNPSNACISNARAVAKLFGIVANGGSWGNKKLLSTGTIKLLEEVLREGKDEVMRMPVRWSRGMLVLDAPLGDSKMVGMTGYGGQSGYFDSTHSIGISYVSNYVTADTPTGKRFDLLAQAVYKVILDMKNQS